MGLYRYKEAFSLHLVDFFLSRFRANDSDVVLDPFAGMGTTLFASMIRKIPSIGIEKLPIAAFVARTLPLMFEIRPGSIRNTFKRLKQRVEEQPPCEIADDVPIINLAFDKETLTRLRKWKSAIVELLDEPMRSIFLLLFFSILGKTSYTSNDGQFLRLKKESKPLYPDEALYLKTEEAEKDVEKARVLWPRAVEQPETCRPQVFLADTRNLTDVQFKKRPNIIITSPPYCNRYDYTRSYCLELCFQFVNNFDELKKIRFGILRSHIESKVKPDEKPSHPAVAEVVKNLQEKKLNNPRIPHMITAYFIDMEKAIKEWSRILLPGAHVALVVDNVRFEGEMLPVDLILSDIAEKYGFKTEEIIVARYKGNSSQQMKKYGKAPARESVVVWRLAQ